VDVVILLESELTFGCPIEMFGDRRIPRWGDVAEQGSDRELPSAVQIPRFKAS